MRALLPLILFILTLSSCSSLKRKSSNSVEDSGLDAKGNIRDLEKILDRAEAKATPEGKEILKTGRSMVEQRRIIRGSCWDYVNAVYNNSGIRENQRMTPLKSKIEGPYADSDSIRAGDWLYFINYSFKEIDHSGIFVEWIDVEKKKAVLLSYVGGKKKKPGSYRIYDLKHVYYIIRHK